MKLVIEFKFRLVLSTIGVIFEFLIVRYLNMTPTSTQLLTPPPSLHRNRMRVAIFRYFCSLQNVHISLNKWDALIASSIPYRRVIEQVIYQWSTHFKINLQNSHYRVKGKIWTFEIRFFLCSGDFQEKKSPLLKKTWSKQKLRLSFKRWKSNSLEVDSFRVEIWNPWLTFCFEPGFMEKREIIMFFQYQLATRQH